MPKYIDGFVIPLPKNKIAEYKKLAKLGCKIWLEHGALNYRECIAEDMDTKMGLPFPKFANLKKGETVVFSWITYKSRKHRDAVNKKVMADERLKDACDPKKMPFDFKRFTYGGFEVIVEGEQK